jgi:cytochrome c oxidase subunit 2
MGRGCFGITGVVMLPIQTALPLCEMLVGDVFFPQQASTIAPGVDKLFYFIFWVCVFFFVLVVGCMVTFLVKYRRTDNFDATGPTHNTLLEATWSVLPFFIVCYMFYEGVVGYMDLRSAPESAQEVKVRAKKWAWEFTYPNGYSSNELHVPPNTPVSLLMQSDDVLHSLFIPAFRVKMDVVPGRYTKLWFDATVPGKYDLECTEYCGEKHSEMLAVVTVHNDRAEYEAWLAKASDVFGPVDRGEKTLAEVGSELALRKGCGQCHSIDPQKSKKTGPAWWGIFGEDHKFVDGSAAKVDENYIRESILKPTAKVVQGYGGNMPSFAGQLKDREIDALIEYIKTLK